MAHAIVRPNLCEPRREGTAEDSEEQAKAQQLRRTMRVPSLRAVSPLLLSALLLLLSGSEAHATRGELGEAQGRGESSGEAGEAPPRSSAQEEAPAVYQVGSARRDITGPVQGMAMMGYGDPMERTSGLLNRLFVRAYVVEQGPDVVALVHCDIHSIPLSMHEAVIHRLEVELGGAFTKDNVALHAQHTHAGPGGLHRYYLYALSVLGFTPLHFGMAVNGIVEAVKEAMAARAPARLYASEVRLHNCSKQRSHEAYAANPAEEREKYDADVNQKMTIVKVTDPGDPTAVRDLWTFFAVHTTSLVGQNNMVSSDNKGYAQWLLEKEHGPGFSAAFFQTEAGDVSPNTVDVGDGTFTGPHGSDFVRSAEAIGKCQADGASAKLREPHASAWTPITGGLLARKVNFDFSKYTFTPEGQPSDPAQEVTTCPGVSGLHMIAGTEDGRGWSFIHEGKLRTQSNLFSETLARKILVRAPLPDAVRDCHLPKRALFVTGTTTPPYTPQVLPMQVIAIGQLTLAVVPFEVTTMAARRMRATLEAALARRASKGSGSGDAAAVSAPAPISVVLACSNAYTGYMTTKEEYDTQHYEGASTHFGPHQLEAVQHMLARLVDGDAAGLRSASAGVVTPEPIVTPYDLATKLLANGGAAAVPPWAELGGVQADVAVRSVRRREPVAASFWCGRPMNSQLLVESFCDVQTRPEAGAAWRTVLRDHDWSVRFLWRPRFLLFGTCTCQWIVPEDQSPGEYRLQMRGMVADDGNNAGRLYTGTSKPFRTLAESAPQPFNSSLDYLYGPPQEIVTALCFVLALTALALRSCCRSSTPAAGPKRKSV